MFRGGGELGREWYLEGKLQNKHKSFEVRLCLLGLSLHRNQTETLSTQARVCYGPCSSNNRRNTVSRFSSLSENVQPFADMKQRQHIHEPNRPTIRRSSLVVKAGLKINLGLLPVVLTDQRNVSGLGHVSLLSAQKPIMKKT